MGFDRDAWIEKKREEEPSVYVGKVKVTGETPMAICVRWNKFETKWIPKSQVHDDSEVVGKGDEGKLCVREWFHDQENDWPEIEA